MPFSGALTHMETQTASSKVWNRVIDSIFNEDDRHANRSFSWFSYLFFTVTFFLSNQKMKNSKITLRKMDIFDTHARVVSDVVFLRF